MRIPWRLILDKAPRLMEVAGELALSSRGRSAEIAASTDARALRDQVAELAKDQQANAALAKDVTDQLDAITKAAQATAHRARQGVVLGMAGIALGIVALALALLR
jgi:hypothetical protein